VQDIATFWFYFIADVVKCRPMTRPPVISPYTSRPVRNLAATCPQMISLKTKKGKNQVGNWETQLHPENGNLCTSGISWSTVNKSLTARNGRRHWLCVGLWRVVDLSRGFVWVRREDQVWPGHKATQRHPVNTHSSSNDSLNHWRFK